MKPKRFRDPKAIFQTAEILLRMLRAPTFIPFISLILMFVATSCRLPCVKHIRLALGMSVRLTGSCITRSNICFSLWRHGRFCVVAASGTMITLIAASPLLFLLLNCPHRVPFSLLLAVVSFPRAQRRFARLPRCAISYQVRVSRSPSAMRA